MKLVRQFSATRVYQSETDPEVFRWVDLEAIAFSNLIERATYESRDPADQKRVETVCTALRLKLALWQVDQEDVDLEGEPVRDVDTDSPPIQPEPGLWVPSIALFVGQRFWPAPPQEVEA